MRFAVALALVLSVAACRSRTMTGPDRSGLTGTWTGSAEDSSGPGRMTWNVVQADASFSGAMTMVDAASNLSGRGSISGTIAASSLHFSISVPVGGFDSPFGSCSSEVSGDAQLSSSSIAGTYSGTNSCTGAITSGRITLSRVN
jgi:hypothetical protein